VRKHRKLLIVLACLAVVAGIVAFATRDDEPHYKGRSLSEWLRADIAHSPTPDGIDPKDAVRAIGTNAIPALLEWLSYEPSGFSETARAFREKLSGPPDSDLLTALQSRVFLAQQGFFILGPEARPAIPQLTTLAMASTNLQRLARFTGALACIGPESLPAVASIITNGTVGQRWLAVGILPALDPNALQALPILTRCLADHDTKVASMAVDVFHRLGLSSATLVPELISNLQNTNPAVRAFAAEQLGRLGTAAVSAVPPLRSLTMLDPNQTARQKATNALLQIAPEVLTNAPAK